MVSIRIFENINDFITLHKGYQIIMEILRIVFDFTHYSLYTGSFIVIGILWNK